MGPQNFDGVNLLTCLWHVARTDDEDLTPQLPSVEYPATAGGLTLPCPSGHVPVSLELKGEIKVAWIISVVRRLKSKNTVYHNISFISDVFAAWHISSKWRAVIIVVFIVNHKCCNCDACSVANWSILALWCRCCGCCLLPALGVSGTVSGPLADVDEDTIGHPCTDG